MSIRTPRPISWLALLFCMAAAAPCQDRRNVLFIAIDDLNDWVGVLGGYDQAKTPHLDQLSKQGFLFRRAYCASPLCNPSRTALMTGLAPYTTGIYYNRHNFRDQEDLQDVLTIPQYFVKHGYYAAGAGKIYHNDWPDPESWHAYWPDKRRHMPADPKAPKDSRLSFEHGAGHFDWHPLDARTEDMGDFKSVQWIADQLRKDHDRPFFLACGIYKPHLPWYIPKDYFDLYPLNDIVLPEILESDLSDVPAFAVGLARGFGDRIDINSADPNHPSDDQMLKARKARKEAIQGYLASISFADHCVGELIKALNQSRYRDNTIVVVWSDHGYHLGEKEHWRKETLWEEATRNVLLICAPSVTTAGSVTDWPVSLLDLYPTLIDLCDLPAKADLAGNSLMQLLKHPSIEWSKPVVTTYGYKNHSVRTKRFRYIVYRDGSEELYDHDRDPHEWYNRAGDEGYAEELTKLKTYVPKENRAPRPFEK